MPLTLRQGATYVSRLTGCRAVAYVNRGSAETFSIIRPTTETLSLTKRFFDHRKYSVLSIHPLNSHLSDEIDRSSWPAMFEKNRLVILQSPVNRVPGAMVSLMDRTNVETVIVAGKVRKWKGRLLDVDLPVPAPPA
jgi:hypothetical protein